MRGRLAQVVLVALGCALAASPLAQARQAAVEADIVAGGTVAMQGAFDGVLEAAAVCYESGWRPADVAASLDVAGARFVLVRVPEATLSLGDNATGPSASHRQLLREAQETLEDSTFTGPVAVVPHSGPSSIRLLPLRPGSSLALPMKTQGAWTLGAPARVLEDARVFNQVEFEGRGSLPPGWVGVLPAPAPLGPLRGDVLLVAYGATLSLGGRTVETGPQPAAAAPPLPGNATASQVDHVVAFLFAKQAQVQVGGPAPEAWSLLLDGVQGRLRGDVAFADVRGATTVNGSRLGDRQDLLQFVGDLRLQGGYGAPDGAWSLAGQAGFVAVDGHAVFGSRWTDAAAAAAGVAGLGVAAWLLALLAGTTDPFGSPTRVRILRAIGASPGATRGQLRRELGLARGTVAFHLAVLRRSSQVDVERLGRQECYHLNSASFRFPAVAAGAPAPDAARVFAALAHPVRRRIFETLHAAGRALHYQEFAAACPGAPRRSLFTYHATLLERNGLLERVRSGRFMLWRATVDLGPLRRRQARAFLASGPRSLVFAAVQERGAATLEDLLAACARQGLPAQPARDALRELFACGFLDRDAGQGLYRVSPRAVHP